MKARVKATGHIVDVELSHYIGDVAWFITKCHASYSENELEFIDAPEDYWTRLEHQYAGMAMQGLSEKYLKEYRDYCAGFGDMDADEAQGAMKDFANAMADVCSYFAQALVEKMKEE